MQRTASCPSCRRGVFAEDAFCSWCGTSIQERDSHTGESRRVFASRTIPTRERETCGSCNSPILPGDQFCSTCGARYATDVGDGGFRESWRTIAGRVTGATRGKYRIVRELGRGGMGIVLMGTDTELERPVAIKVLAPSLLADESMVERFQREARIIAGLRHESIVSVYDVGRDGDLYFFVMDFIDGVSLSRVLRRHGPLPVPVVETFLLQVGAALAYAHRPGRTIVHRDVKPSNIMVDAEGIAVVTDFGISKVTATPGGLTRTGLVIGTPEYMSPEQCRGATVTPESDQYSLGAVVYAMLTGAPPFTGPFYQVLMAHQTEPVPPLAAARPDCPEELADAVERMLAKRPTDRWASIREALRTLGLRPPLSGDRVLELIAELVRETRSADEDTEGSAPAGERGTPTSVRIAPLPDELETGDEVDLRATVVFPNRREDTPPGIRWESTDPSILQIDAGNGRLIAVGAGSAEVSAVLAGVSHSVAVEIREARVVELALDADTLEVEVGETRRVTAEPRNRRGGVLDRPVLWSSSNPRTASVTEGGAVEGHRPGEANVVAHCQGVGASLDVRVVPATVAGIEVTGPDGSLTVGDVVSLEATPRGRWGQPLERPLRWVSSAPAIAEVDQEGTLRALSPGAVEIGVECEGRKELLALRVLPAPVASLAIEGAPSSLRVGERAALGARARDAEGRPLEREVAWSSRSPDVLRVGPGGRLEAVEEGAAEIVASCEGRVATVTVAVTPPPVTLIEVSSPADPLVVGDTFHLEARMFDRRGRPRDGSPRWDVDGSRVLQPLAPGLFRAVAPGDAVVTASADEAETRVHLTVEEELPEPVTLIAGPEAPAPEMRAGEAPQPAAPGPRPDGTRPFLLRRPAAWIWPVLVLGGALAVWLGLPPGDPPAPTTVAEVRLVTAVGERPVDDPVRLLEGESLALAALAFDDAGSPVDHEARWSTSDPSIAGVDASGSIRGVGPGEATVSVRAGALSAGVRVVIGARPVDLAITAPDGRPIGGSATLDEGEGRTLRGLVTDRRGDAVDGAVVWRSSDPSVASIGPDGALRAAAPGVATVTATSGGLSAALEVRVEAAAPVVVEDQEGPPPEPPPVDTSPGTLRLRIQGTWAFVRVDGELQDPDGTRVLSLPLPPGRYQLELSRPGYVTVDTTITIRPGQVEEIVRGLRPGG